MKKLPRLLAVVVLLPAVFVGSAPGTRADDPKGGPEEFKHLKYRSIGPYAGGRVARACGVAGDPLTYYAATASGGVWKSSDAGVTWKPIFDDQPISSIGSIAVAPSDPNVVYVGSGEANIRGNVAAGNGIYKSTDAGKTWKHVWKQEGQIGTLIVHPKNPNIAFAAVLGHAFGPNAERGVYRTTDGGQTWKQVLKKDADTGASDVCFDASNPRVLFAGLWQARRKPWEMTSGGPGSGLYKSDDGGDTWTHLVPPPADDSPDAGKDAAKGKKYCSGLPEGVLGRIGVGVAPSNGQRVYALIEAEKGGLFRSDDGGDSWSRVNDNRALQQRIWYFGTLTPHPTNPDVVWFPQVPLLKTIDGGKTLVRVKGTHHGDHHDIWIDPRNPNRIIDSNDGGVDISTNSGESWYAPPLPISQFYHIETDNSVPYRVMGNMQDLGTASGPSNSLGSDGIQLGEWHTVGGGETGVSVPDPTDPNVVYAGEYAGIITRYDHRTRQAKNVSIYPFNASGHAAGDLKYRFQWTAPIHISPHDHKVVYHGGNVLFRTEDGGQTWQAISKDLTRDDKTKQQWSGGPITGDNTTAEYYCTIFAVAESPKQKGVIWAGSDDGLVHVTRDGGKTWENVTPNIKGLPEWGTVSCIEPSPTEAGTAYVVVDAHRLDDMKPYLWKTDDFGKTWKSLSGGLPQDVYLHVVRRDPKKGLLFVGTERGVAFSTDDGATWQQLKLNLPTVAVHDLKVKGDDLVVGTSGRAIWILDDITPLRELTKATTEKTAALFTPAPATRWRTHYSPEGGLGGKRSGTNPPSGAVIHYWLKKKPKDEMTLEILDAKGTQVRKLSSKAKEEEKAVDVGAYSDPDKNEPDLTTHAGVNRVVWDLTHEPPKGITGAKTDGGGIKQGPVVLPGTYTLKLTVDGQTQTQPIEVRLDPRVSVQVAGPRQPVTANPLPEVSHGSKPQPQPGSPAGSLEPDELQKQSEMALKLRDDITRLSGLADRLRSVKKQLTTRNDLLKDDDAAKDLVKGSKEFVTKLDEVEGKLHNPKAQVSYDILAQKGGAKLYSQLTWLYGLINDADGAPPQGWREVYEEQRALLDKLEAEVNKLLGDELTKLNEQARKIEVPPVIVPKPAKKP